MSNNYIKYPAAFDFITNKVVPISKVTGDNKLNLFCPVCRRNFIAVLNHKTPHFKHKPINIRHGHSLKCSANPETFLHWLTKEILKEVEEIEIPELLIDDLPEKQRQKFQLKFNELIDPNIPESFRSTFKKGLKKTLSESKILFIENSEIEKEFETELGNIRVDVVVTVKNKNIFIEPFYTNPIDKEKKKKLSLINIPTLSLDLLTFMRYYGQDYSYEQLKQYLISKNSKKWIYLSDKVYEKHISNYENYLLIEIEKNKESIESHNLKLNEISTLELECQKLFGKINILKEEIEEIEGKISILKKEIGIFY